MSRADQREQTKARILTAARNAFADQGYDRTTIRAIASTAGVNAGLVMHYYGSKERLFAAVTEPATDEPFPEGSADVTEQLLASLHAKLTEEPSATLAMLRSMLTHQEATDGVRASLSRQQQALSDALTADDAVLRTGLTGAITLGVVVARHLLRLDGVRDASPDDIVRLLRPCVESLTRPSA